MIFMQTVGEKFQQAQDLLGKITDMKKRPTLYGLQDLHDFLERDVDTLSRLLDDIEYEVKDYVQTRYTQPDQFAQLEMNQELEEVAV